MQLIVTRLFSALALLLMLAPARAADTEAIAADAAQALEALRTHVAAAGPLLDEAAGILVFPQVVKVGFGGADEYGEGCLLVAGRPVAYYATAGAPFGLPLGVRAKSEVVLFMDAESLAAFRARHAWEVGADGGVTLVRAAAGGGIEGAIDGESVLGFIFTEQGLAGGLTLEGARFTRLAR
jgi:lipid-binding SYLF domain-containing protein